MTKFRHTVLAALVAAGLSLTAGAAEVAYTLDPGHTDVVATWTHMGFSTPSAMFSGADGTLKYDPQHPERAVLEVKLPIASVHTPSAGLNEHLQQPDFFDAAKYPDAVFKSTKVERGATPDTLKVTGNLTMHGVTHPLTLDVHVNKVGTHAMSKAPTAGFTATATLQRSDWGVKTYVPMISDEIRLRITTEAVETKAWQAMQKG